MLSLKRTGDEANTSRKVDRSLHRLGYPVIMHIHRAPHSATSDQSPIQSMPITSTVVAVEQGEVPSLVAGVLI